MKFVGKFPCVKCGLCCKQLDPSQLKLLGLPEHPNQPGCGNLQADNSCGIYATRPEFCNVAKGVKYSGMSREKWFEANWAECEKRIKEAGWTPPPEEKK